MYKLVSGLVIFILVVTTCYASPKYKVDVTFTTAKGNPVTLSIPSSRKNPKLNSPAGKKLLAEYLVRLAKAKGYKIATATSLQATASQDVLKLANGQGIIIPMKKSSVFTQEMQDQSKLGSLCFTHTCKDPTGACCGDNCPCNFTKTSVPCMAGCT